jgi:anaerobic magnesium-protoporphyrin IX monomethyl ester cyclase
MPLPLPLFPAPPSRVEERDTACSVLLVGFQNQGNLGLGYLAATLRQQGYTVQVIDVEADPSDILEKARALNPVLIGFSLIFQFYIDRYGALIRYLRANGVICHFTMGGHFPSLSYEHTLALVPELDSVVRFEGEMTLLELVDRLGTGRDWRAIEGIAYTSGGRVIATELRPLLDDLDRLSYPDRDFKPIRTLGHSLLPLLASRGCARTCSFCSIQTFYRAAPGKIVRTRKPAMVVAEMKALHEDRGATIFLFQDDDFPLFGPVWQRWAREFVQELHRSGLSKRVIWKMNCRADAVEPDIFAAMRDAGLYLVYMGLESGNEEGLRTLHKQVSVAQNLQAVRTLKQLGLLFEYGFMLFDPSSTFESVRANLAFLRTIVGDGSTAATFCRMLPYDGTPIKDDLKRAGRLRGDVCNPDYDFLDPRLTEFYEALTEYVDIRGWIHGFGAMAVQLSWAWNEVAVMERLFPPIPAMPEYRRTLLRIAAAANDYLLRIVEDLCSTFSEGRPNGWSAAEVEARRLEFLEELVRQRNAFVASHQDHLVAALPDSVRGQMMTA